MQVMALTKALLRNLGPKAINLIIDIWTSPQKSSILGIEAQFIKDWKLQRKLLGFLSFHTSHTSDNVKQRVYGHIESAYGLVEDHVRAIN
jgi:hypothetical protein